MLVYFYGVTLLTMYILMASYLKLIGRLEYFEPFWSTSRMILMGILKQGLIDCNVVIYIRKAGLIDWNIHINLLF